MKKLEKIRKRIKQIIKGKKQPVVRIDRRDPWGGQKVVRIPVRMDVKNFDLYKVECRVRVRQI